MSDRETALARLREGDIFHAASPNGASLICLVISITESTLNCRTVTSQIYLEFDRKTGVAYYSARSVPCKIDSIAPLPVDIHGVMLDLDQKFRSEYNEDNLRLRDAEKKHYHLYTPFMREPENPNRIKRR